MTYHEVREIAEVLKGLRPKSYEDERCRQWERVVSSLLPLAERNAVTPVQWEELTGFTDAWVLGEEDD